MRHATAPPSPPLNRAATAPSRCVAKTLAADYDVVPEGLADRIESESWRQSIAGVKDWSWRSPRAAAPVAEPGTDEDAELLPIQFFLLHREGLKIQHQGSRFKPGVPVFVARVRFRREHRLGASRDPSSPLLPWLPSLLLGLCFIRLRTY